MPNSHWLPLMFLYYFTAIANLIPQNNITDYENVEIQIRCYHSGRWQPERLTG